jgi:enoyl-[acyl-carrier-protein] reductase (NADH)
VTIDDVGAYAAFLASADASNITGGNPKAEKPFNTPARAGGSPIAFRDA